jgi:hypothetical protein
MVVSKGVISTNRTSGDSGFTDKEETDWQLIRKRIPPTKGSAEKNRFIMKESYLNLEDKAIAIGGEQPCTTFPVRLVRAGIGINHRWSYYSQTMGQDECVHGRLTRAVLRQAQCRDPPHSPLALNRWARSIMATGRMRR